MEKLALLDSLELVI
jgi:hypothetical protein